MDDRGRGMLLIDSDGNWKYGSCNLIENEVEHNVVAALGPQNIGKSTLLNEVFATNFKTLDERHIGSQTTRGVWIAEVDEGDRHTLVLDIEGSDSAERGEIGGVLERRLGTFCLAVSHTIIFNINFKDLGRATASGWPLFRDCVKAYNRLPDTCRMAREPLFIMAVRDVPLNCDRNAIERRVLIKALGHVRDLCETSFGEDIIRVHCLSYRDSEEDDFISDCMALRAMIQDAAQEPLITLSRFIERGREVWDAVMLDSDVSHSLIQQLVAIELRAAFTLEKKHPCEPLICSALDKYAQVSKCLSHEDFMSGLENFMRPLVECVTQSGLDILADRVSDQIQDMLTGDPADLRESSLLVEQKRKLEASKESIKIHIKHKFSERNFVYTRSIVPDVLGLEKWLEDAVSKLQDKENRRRLPAAILGGIGTGLSAAFMTGAAVVAAPVAVPFMAVAAMASALGSLIGVGGAYFAGSNRFHKEPLGGKEPLGDPAEEDAEFIESLNEFDPRKTSRGTFTTFEDG